MNKLMENCNNGMHRMTRSMHDAFRNQRRHGKVAGYEREIRHLTEEIGHLTVLELDHPGQHAEAVNERYARILALRDMISESEAAETAAQPKRCPACGRTVASGMHYCGFCGEALPTELPESVCDVDDATSSSLSGS